mmetsp:Transcript_16033/g.49954  ORF Transcript_16033/g.49954 Transcript_16033/m.49954 type:complete len:211 (-) Transcript_16033:343-975(-)
MGTRVQTVEQTAAVTVTTSRTAIPSSSASASGNACFNPPLYRPSAPASPAATSAQPTGGSTSLGRWRPLRRADRSWCAARAASSASAARRSASRSSRKAACSSACAAVISPERSCRVSSHNAGPSRRRSSSRTVDVQQSNSISRRSHGERPSNTCAARSCSTACRCNHCAVTSRTAISRAASPAAYAFERTKRLTQRSADGVGRGCTSHR